MELHYIPTFSTFSQSLLFSSNYFPPAFKKTFQKRIPKYTSKKIKVCCKICLSFSPEQFCMCNCKHVSKIQMLIQKRLGFVVFKSPDINKRFPHISMSGNLVLVNKCFGYGDKAMVLTKHIHLGAIHKLHYDPLMMQQKEPRRKHPCVLPKKVAFLV